MKRQKQDTLEIQKEFAINLNNRVWALMAKDNRSESENDEMINAAHASLYHWSQVGTDLNIQRGEWLVSRVYAILGKSEGSQFYAKKCLELTEKNNFVDFDKAYACEAMARAYAISGYKVECHQWLDLTRRAADKIKNKEDKDLFLSDFESEPWNNLK